MSGVYNVTAGRLQASICETGRESNNNNVMNANIVNIQHFYMA